MDRFDAMATFIQVTEEGSFTAAANVLNQPKSAVSKTISSLEKHLNTRLLNRTTRRLSLTDAGRTYLERCRAILAEVEEAEAEAVDLHANPRGRLRVSAPMSFGIRHLAPLLPPFMADHPEIGLEVLMDDSRVDLVEEGFDVAVRIGHLPDSSLIARKLGEARLIIMASPDYVAREGVPEKPADLSGHDCLLYDRPGPATWSFRQGRRSVAQRISGPFRTNNGDAILEAAISGTGIARLPTFICGPAIRDGKLVPLLEDCEDSPVGIYAVFAESQQTSAKIRVFVDHLVKAFKGSAF